MSSIFGKKPHDMIAIVFVGVVIAFFAVIFVFELAVALKYEYLKDVWGTAMVLGFAMWLYTVAMRLKKAKDAETPELLENKTKAEIAFDVIWLFGFVVSCLALIMPGVVPLGLWANVVIAYWFLQTAIISGFGKLGIDLDIFKKWKDRNGPKK